MVHFSSKWYPILGYNAYPFAFSDDITISVSCTYKLCQMSEFME